MPPSRPWLPLAAVGMSVILWSTAYVLSALVLVTASPAVLSELRLALAVPLMIVLLAVRRRAAGVVELLLVLRDLRTFLLGLTGVALHYLPSNLGLAATGAGTAALVSASLPVLTAALAWIVLRERVTGGVLVGLVLTTGGVALASLGATAGAGPGAGAILLVAGLVSYAAYTVLLRRWGTPVAPRATRGGRDAAGRPVRDVPDALVLATATAIWGAVLLSPWLGVEIALGTAAWPSDATGWTSILLLSFVVTVPTMVLFNYGAERVPAAVSGAATAGVPVLGYAFAVLLGEAPQPVKVLGGAIALAGIVVAAIAARPRIDREQAALLKSAGSARIPDDSSTGPVPTARG